jgi:uncharacterized FlaG/YvyC family protein
MDSLKPKKEWKRHKVQPGHNVFRILPPFGDDSNGYPYRKWMVIWGLLDPESGRARPFASSLTTEKRCPIFEYVEALQKKAEVIKAQLQTKGSSDEEVKEALKPLNKVISTLRPKTVFAYNASDKAGTVGILEVKSTAQKILKEQMMQYIKDYNQDPTSLNSDSDDSGVWFDFVRTGEFFDTEYDVQKLQTKTKVNGQMTYIDDRSPLAENIVENYDDLAYNLGSIYQIKTYDQLREILMANLKTIVKDTPEALVAGWDDFSDAPDVNDDGKDGGGGNAPAKSATKSVETKGTSKVNLKLADDTDEDLADAASKDTNLTSALNAGSRKTAVKPTSSDDDDIFALADSILQG